MKVKNTLALNVVPLHVKSNFKGWNVEYGENK